MNSAINSYEPADAEAFAKRLERAAAAINALRDERLTPDGPLCEAQWCLVDAARVVRRYIATEERLVLHLKGEYFESIKAGTKLEEYRLLNAYWRKRLEDRAYEGILLLKGYPALCNPYTRLERPWRGYKVKRITHPHFGAEPVDVYAIKVNE